MLFDGGEILYKITIPEDIYKKIEARVEDSEFKNVEEYIIYILERVIEKLESKEKNEEEEEIKRRLRDLGYGDASLDF